MSIIKYKPITFSKGDPANQPIIFIHGFPFDHNMWSNQINELSLNYFCVSYDIRGLGESPAGDGLITMEILAEDVLEIMEKEKLNKPVLCGLSMGGYIAQRAVEKNENLFRALILCDTKSSADNNEAKIKRAQGIKEISETGVKKYIEKFIPNCFAEESISKLGDVYKETLNRSLNFSPSGVKGCLLAMAARTDTTEFISEIKIPVLLICGEKDKLTPPYIMEQMAQSIPDSEFHIIPKAGHITPLENPETVNKIIKDFLSRNIRKSTG